MNNRDRKRARIRKTIQGSDTRPRVVVFRSNKYLYAQAIDDGKGQTLASVDKAVDPVVAGKNLGAKILAKKISSVVFDRAGYKYHGNIKKLADAIRESGLKV